MMKRMAVTGLVVAACGLAGLGGLAGVATAAAEEVRQQLNAPMILNLLARPLESPEAAFNKELKNYAGAAPRAMSPKCWRTARSATAGGPRASPSPSRIRALRGTSSTRWPSSRPTGNCPVAPAASVAGLDSGAVR